MTAPTVQIGLGLTETGSGTSHDIDLTGGGALSAFANGDLGLMWLGCDGVPAITHTGWTSQGWSGNGHTSGVLWRLCDGTEGSLVNFTTDASEAFAVAVGRVAAAEWFGDLANGLFVDNSGSISGAITNPDPPLVTPSVGSDDYLVCASCTYDNGTGAITVTAYPYASQNVNYSGAFAGGVGVGVCTTTITGTSEDPGAFTISSADNTMAATVMVRASGGGGGAAPAGITKTLHSLR